MPACSAGTSTGRPCHACRRSPADPRGRRVGGHDRDGGVPGGHGAIIPIGAPAARLRTCQSGKLACMLSNMESTPQRPTAPRPPPRSPTPRRRARGLALAIATPSWFFASMGIAIAAQIATTAVASGSGRRGSWWPGSASSAPSRASSSRGSGGCNGVWLGGFASRVVLGTGTARLALVRRRARSGDLGGLRRAGGPSSRCGRPSAARRTRSTAAGGCAPIATSRRRTGAGSRSRGWRCCSVVAVAGLVLLLLDS